MKTTQQKGWREVVEKPFPDFKPDPKIWPNGPSMDGVRPVWDPEEYEKRRKKILETPLP